MSNQVETSSGWKENIYVFHSQWITKDKIIPSSRRYR